MNKPINMIWAEEAGLKVVIREAEQRPDRRVIEIVQDGYPDIVLASATIAKHNLDRVADAIRSSVRAGEVGEKVGDAGKSGVVADTSYPGSAALER